VRTGPPEDPEDPECDVRVVGGPDELEEDEPEEWDRLVRVVTGPPDELPEDELLVPED
jgi:hypothetical protein